MNPNKKMLMLASVPSMIGQFNMNNIKILREIGYEVMVACNFDDRSVWNENEIIQFKRKLALMNVKTVQINVSRNVKDIKAHKKTYRQLKELLEREQFTFIHCHTPIVSALVRMIARKLPVKIVYTAHGFHFYKGASWVNWIAFYPIERCLSHYTDVLITINREDYKRAKSFRAHSVVYIPGVGLDVEHFHLCKKSKEEKRKELNIKENQLVLLSVGELSARKNHEIIIKALAHIQKDDIIYYIAGIGELKEEYENLISELGLQNQVKLLGVRSDIDELCKMADIFVHPSVREGLGIAALEGMASGLPLICSNANGIKDYAIDGVTGYCVEPYDIEGFSRAILELENNSALREKMGQASYETAKKFDISNTEKIMRKVYANIEERGNVMNKQRIFYHLRHSVEYAKNVGTIRLIQYYWECFCHIKGSDKEKSIIQMRYKKYNLKCYLRKNSADLLVFGNVCLGESYEFALKEFDNLPSVEYIVDLGANIGITSKILALRYPKAKIVSVEPDADNFRVLKANMKVMEHAACLKCGVWNKKTKLAILRGKEEYGFRLVEDKNGTIPVIGLNELIEEMKMPRIDILKIDIEGSEYQLFDESAEKWLDIVQSIVIEIHDHLVEGCYDRVHNAMISKGFSEIKSPRNEESVFLYKKSKGEQ